MTGIGEAPGLGEGYGREGRNVLDGVRWGMEWSAGYERRPSQHAQRWSWQNRGGTVTETEARVVMAKALLAEHGEMVRGEVARADVERVLGAWIKSTGASALGRTWSVTHPDGLADMKRWLIDGPVGAVLADLGFDVG